MNRPERHLIVGFGLVLALLLSSCSSVFTSDYDVSSMPDPSPMFHDELFPYTDVVLIEPASFLSLPDNYKAELDRVVRPLESEYERYRALRRWVYRHFESYEFDTTETYSIGELNTNRKINCLSFSAIFVAAARYVDIPADFQLVFAPPYWDSENGTWINNQHVDVTGSIELEPNKRNNANSRFFSNFPSEIYYYHENEFFRMIDSNNYRYVVDINPAIVGMPLRRKMLHDQQVLSLLQQQKHGVSTRSGSIECLRLH